MAIYMLTFQADTVIDMPHWRSWKFPLNPRAAKTYIFTEMALRANSVIESPCPSVCLSVCLRHRKKYKILHMCADSSTDTTPSTDTTNSVKKEEEKNLN